MGVEPATVAMADVWRTTSPTLRKTRNDRYTGYCRERGLQYCPIQTASLDISLQLRRDRQRMLTLWLERTFDHISRCFRSPSTLQTRARLHRASMERYGSSGLSDHPHLP